MSRKIIPILVIVLLLLTVSCSRSLTGKSGTVVPAATDYIKLTVDAMRPPTITPSPTHDIALGTMTPIPPTPTLMPTSTPSQDPNCFYDLEAEDIAIEDGEVLKIKQPFTKIRKITNIGSCYWTDDFNLVFIGGAQMDGKSPIPLGETVYKKKSIEVSLDLVAPSTPGDYVGYWQLQDELGYPVGLVWVEITAVEP